MTFALETTNLGKRYRSNWALRHCTLAIPEGRITALIGPNGAGKSTLMSIAAGLLEPTEGGSMIFGSSVQDSPAVLARIGYVAQNRPLYRDFTVAEILRFGASLNPRWDGAMARKRLDRLQIPLESKVRELSGGQHAQVALVLALAKGAEFIVLDEPVAALDPLARREFLQTLMDEAVATGLTVLLSSHLISELERVSDYLILLNRGSVQFAGDTDDFEQSHRLLVGPRADSSDIQQIHNVVFATHTDRQSSVLVRSNGHPFDQRWDVRNPGFEEIVLAYLARRENDVEITR